MSAKDEASHFKLLGEVFGRLEKHGFRLKRDKCQFLHTTVGKMLAYNQNFISQGTLVDPSFLHVGHQFIDYHLNPLVRKIPSYMKDTTDFLLKLQDFDNLTLHM